MNADTGKSQTLARQTIENLVREEWGRLLAALIARLGDFQLAEDALQDGLESALVHWQRNGLPRSPAAWLLQTARRKAIDRIRRAANFRAKEPQISHLMELDAEEMAMEETPEIPDERLALIFTCCHPALEAKSRTALTLRTLGGLNTGEIARAFLDGEQAMAQRLVRAKRKIKQAKIPYRVPESGQWDERLHTVLGVLYLIFNEGYFSSHGDAQVRVGLSNEAIRLVRILLTLKPGEAETEGLLALMMLHDSRRGAREDASGFMVALEHQDRSLWDRGKIFEGMQMLERALLRRTPGPYQIQAAISAVHAQARDHDSTDWDQIVQLYDELFRFQPNPVVRLNQIAALSYAKSPKLALEQLGELEQELAAYQPFHATRADLLHRTGRINAAEVSYNRAIELSSEEKTRAFLSQKLGRMLRGS
ncbi:MAG TPA: RNA polymerase sigma factor [Devosia sp.]|nr:RNA polymerase sigma factor [Devosia sp.]